jgi:hypothetical protein
MKTHIQELMALYHLLDEIGQIIDSENSGLSAEQRLSEIERTIKKLFQNTKEK